ncbi:hypothetical protein BH24GEM2_BH24GEM2_07150 [soil metagenome]
MLRIDSVHRIALPLLAAAMVLLVFVSRAEAQVREVG